MASTGLTAVMNPQQHSGLHPFFIKTSSKPKIESFSRNTISEVALGKPTTKSISSKEISTNNEPVLGDRTPETSAGPSEPTFPPTKHRLEDRPGASEQIGSEDEKNNGNEDLEVDPNFGRRKRLRSAEPDAVPEGTQQEPNTSVQERDAQSPNEHTSQIVIPMPHMSVNGSTAPNTLEQTPQNGTYQQHWSKSYTNHQFVLGHRILKLSGKGTLSSPTSIKTSESLVQRPSSKSRTKIKQEGIEESSEPGTTTKKRKSPKSKSKSRIVIFKYDNNDLGQRLSRILSGEEKYQPPSTVTEPKEPVNKLESHLPPHPFFAKKSKQAVEDVNTNSETVTGSEPTSISTPVAAEKQTSIVTGQTPKPTASLFGRTIGSKSQSMARHDTRYPLWPWKGVTRVDPESESYMQEDERVADDSDLQHPKKSKSTALFVTNKEDILEKKLSQLKLGLDVPLSIDSACFNVRDGLRVPKKLIWTGPKIQALISEQLSQGRHTSSPFVLNINQLHPAIRHLYLSIESYMSPFDIFHCETQSWILKYAPSSAEQVLQSGIEAKILKHWLTNLKVNQVDTGRAQDSGSDQPKRMSEKPKKKRKRASELDDFVVSESDEEASIGEFEDLEDSSRPMHRRSMVRQTQSRRPNSEKMPMANVVLLSGPNGCGKSATVYAVARELGFEVFEINPGSRRSGKDILDKIGDMAENHLVQVVSKAVAEASSISKKDTESTNIPESPNARQGNMESFFKPMAMKAVSKSGPQKGGSNSKSTNVNKTTRQQKQSLILFEEVDFLFAEDKQFWATVTALALHSKRPIILTCNDESLVPFESLTLHAILRLEPPPVTLATDYLLTMAGREGHIVDPNAIRELYAATGQDLRRSISTLDFYCQMAVGDQRGGLDWLIDRWPPGSDLDESGHRVRVVSDGTYLPGIDWKNHDIVTLDRDTRQLAENELNIAMKEWKIPLERLAHEGLINEDLWKGGIDSLADFEAISESLSSVDIYCGFSLWTGLKVPIITSSSCLLAYKCLGNS
jgi:DNA polymerase III delta prime subunit